MARRKGSKNKKSKEEKSSNNDENICENNQNIANPNEINALNEFIDYYFFLPFEKLYSSQITDFIVNTSELWRSGQSKPLSLEFIKDEPKINLCGKYNDSFLKTFFTHKLISYISEQSNKSLASLFSLSKPIEKISNEEIMKFIGISILMGVCKLPNQIMYWDAGDYDNLNIKNLFIINTMSRDRFVTIRNYFRFTKFIGENDNSSIPYKEKLRM